VPRRRGNDTFEDVTDDELVARALAGDERAWDEIIYRYTPYVFAVVSLAFGIGGLAAE